MISLSQRTSRILSAYVDDKAYSVELAGAVSFKRRISYNFFLLLSDKWVDRRFSAKVHL